MSQYVGIALLGILLFVAFFTALMAIARRRVRLRRRVLAEGASESGFSVMGDRLSSRAEQFFEPIGEKVPGRSPEDLNKERLRLAHAGYRKENAVFVFYGVRVFVILGAFIALSTTSMPSSNPLLWLLLPVLAGMILPDVWLQNRIAARKRNIQNGLPDMMDLVVVCVEAGLGLDQALSRVGRELAPTYPVLSGELSLYNLEVNAGLRRAQALRNLAARTGVDDLRSLSGTLVQADRFGTSIADSLRVFSDTLRTKRRQRAEEQAAQMNIKMIVPLILFIFPAVLVVVAGPAVITIYRDLLPALSVN